MIKALEHAPELPWLREVTDPQRDRDRIVVEGRVALERALGAGVPFEVIVGNREQLETLTVPDGTAVYETDRAGLEELLGYRMHRGVLGALRRKRWSAPSLPLDRPRVLIPVLIGMADPVNVGAIIRSAAAFGATGVMVDAKAADPFSRRAVRASMGHCFSLPVLVGEPDAFLAGLNRGRVLATTPSAQQTLSSLPRGSRDIVLFGHEGYGLDLERFGGATEIRIEIADGVDSLNVAASAAIVLHHLRHS
ncbi:MAG: RNA methyltransferase [Myxococcota bacterium]